MTNLDLVMIFAEKKGNVPGCVSGAKKVISLKVRQEKNCKNHGVRNTLDEIILFLTVP